MTLVWLVAVFMVRAVSLAICGKPAKPEASIVLLAGFVPTRSRCYGATRRHADRGRLSIIVPNHLNGKPILDSTKKAWLTETSYIRTW